MKKSFFTYSFTIQLKITILLLWLFSVSSILYSQEIPSVNVTLKLKVEGGDFNNSQIIITKAGTPYKIIEPKSGGEAVDLPLGFEYAFTFTKSGYNTKRFLVDTHVPEYRERGVFKKQISEVTLEKISGKLEDNYVQLIGKIAYSMSKADFDFENNSGQETTQKSNKVVANHTQVLPSLTNKNPIQQDVSQTKEQSRTNAYEPNVKKKVVRVIQEDYRKYTIITITNYGKDIVFKKEEYGWGTFYYKDGKQITETTFDNETK